MEITGKSGHWIESNSAEYDLVRFQLLSSINENAIIDKLTIWKLDNPELVYRYERRSNGMNRQLSWFNADKSNSYNTLERICSTGFSCDEQTVPGLQFSIGVIDDTELSYNKENCFVLLDLAIGRSFIYDGPRQRANIPAGYDSLYLAPQALDRNRDGKFSAEEYNSAATFDNRNSW